MADINTPPASAEANRRPRTRQDEQTSTNGEHRAFAAPDTARVSAPPHRSNEELVGVAREFSQATREMGERSRQATQEMATNWRGAMEPLLGLSLEMNRWLDDVWGQMTGAGAFSGLRPARPSAAWSMAPLLGLPPTDVREAESAYMLCMELPGLTREDVDLQIRNDTLFISGHKAEAKENAGVAYRVNERRFGHFERRFPIPAEVERDRIEASFRDGVLNVTLPKAATAKQHQHRIEIKG
jgi:HSP20 family protein